jgi:hypothetical protein
VDFIIGSFTTLTIIILMYAYFSKLEKIVNVELKYNFSQSSVHEMIKPLLPDDFFKQKKKRTQSSVYEEKTNVRVIILDGLAYWIRDNKIYEADMNSDGIDKDSTRVVDTMSMDRVQLDKITFIVDALREGLDDDSGSSGNK